MTTKSTYQAQVDAKLVNDPINGLRKTHKCFHIEFPTNVPFRHDHESLLPTNVPSHHEKLDETGTVASLAAYTSRPENLKEARYFE